MIPNLMLTKQQILLHYVQEVFEFCRKHENGKVLDNWPDETVKKLIAHHLMKGTLEVSRNENDEIGAVCMWYNCDYEDDWEFIRTWQPDNPEGDTILIAFLWAATTDDWKRLTANVLDRHPEVLAGEKKITSFRNKHGFLEKVDYNIKLFKKVLRL